MDITLDIGGNTWSEVDVLAQHKGKRTEHMALDLIELGLKVAKTEKGEEEQVIDPLLQALTENNLILKEVIRCVFDQTKISEPLFEAESLLLLIQQKVKTYLRGKQAADLEEQGAA